MKKTVGNLEHRVRCLEKLVGSNLCNGFYKSFKFESTNQEIMQNVFSRVLNYFIGKLSLDNKGIYLDLVDHYGDSIPYQGYVHLDKVTQSSMTLSFRYPREIELSDVTNVSQFTPVDRSEESLSSAINIAVAYADSSFEDDLSDAMIEHSYIEKSEVEFTSLFSLSGFDDPEEAAFDYLVRKIESYKDRVTRLADEVAEIVETEMASIIDNLEYDYDDARHNI